MRIQGHPLLSRRIIRISAYAAMGGLGLSLAVFLAVGGGTELGHLGKDAQRWVKFRYWDVRWAIENRDQIREDRVRKREGARDATSDVGSGIYKVIWRGGPPTDWHAEYIRYVHENCPITIDYNFSCLVSSGEAAYAEGYNSVSVPAIEERFGKKFLDNTKAEFTKTWRAGDTELPLAAD